MLQIQLELYPFRKGISIPLVQQGTGADKSALSFLTIFKCYSYQVLRTSSYQVSLHTGNIVLDFNFSICALFSQEVNA